jgi:drug/metabolite transporter (DMT)-like permease
VAWFTVALAAFFLFAVAGVTDKLILARTAVVPASFAFYISVMGALASAVLFIPIIVAEGRFFVPTGFPLTAIAVCGIAQYFGLLFMFEAVNRSEVSKANPVIVSLQPVFNVLLTLLLPLALGALFHGLVLDLQLVTGQKLAGVGLIIAGSYLLSQTGEGATRFDLKTWLYIVLAGFFLALSTEFASISYSVFDRVYLPLGAGEPARKVLFAKAFIWGRWMALAGGLAHVLATGNLRALTMRQPGQNRETVARRGWVAVLFLFGQGCGALAVVLQQYAIKLGNVILVSALNGTQFFFVIAVSAVVSHFFPRLLSERTTRKILLQKILWSGVLFGGIALIVI